LTALTMFDAPSIHFSLWMTYLFLMRLWVKTQRV
jgi:hypothetical protein